MLLQPGEMLRAANPCPFQVQDRRLRQPLQQCQQQLTQPVLPQAC
jgi:hypothetical protein